LGFTAINQYGAKKFSWNPDGLYDILNGMRDEGLKHKQMQQRLSKYHENWDCSIATLKRKLREFDLMGAKGQGYTDDEVEVLVLEYHNAANPSYDGIRSIQTRMRTKGVMIGRYRLSVQRQTALKNDIGTELCVH